MPVEDKAAARRVERELWKLPIDPTLVTVSVINGVCYIGGRVRRMRTPEGRGVDLRKAMRDFEEIARQLPGIRDVVIDAFIEM
ncbi:MAG: hypothetical protein H5T86_04800 [Armatimonadetes bacterium]|nr:hypothetical protein [Armatimonadota bacterium]